MSPTARGMAGAGAVVAVCLGVLLTAGSASAGGVTCDYNGTCVCSDPALYCCGDGDACEWCCLNTCGTITLRCPAEGDDETTSFRPNLFMIGAVFGLAVLALVMWRRWRAQQHSAVQVTTSSFVPASDSQPYHNYTGTGPPTFAHQGYPPPAYYPNQQPVAGVPCGGPPPLSAPGAGGWQAPEAGGWQAPQFQPGYPPPPAGPAGAPAGGGQPSSM